MKNHPQKIYGYLLGMAVGDALGLPYEGMSAEKAARRLGPPVRHRFCLGNGMISDDTEHAVMTLIAASEAMKTGCPFNRLLARRLVAWLWRFPAGVGFATLRSLLKLSIGWPPSHSGVYSAGNGPAMRSGVLGLLFPNSPDLLRENVTASTLLTHTHPLSLAGALAYAVTCAQALQRPLVAETLRAALTEALALLPDADVMRQTLHQAIDSALLQEPVATFAAAIGSRHGISGYILHTIPCVLQCALRHGNDYAGGVQEIIQAGGDTDTTAALLGGLIGIRVGEMGIPRAWQENLRDTPISKKYLRKLANSTHRDTPIPNPILWVLRNLFFTTIVLLHGALRLVPMRKKKVRI